MIASTTRNSQAALAIPSRFAWHWWAGTDLAFPVGGIADDATSLEEEKAASLGRRNMSMKALQPSDLPKPGNFLQGIEAAGSRMIFVSGNVAVDAAGKTVAPGDIKGQTRQVFANIEKILAEAGATRDDIVKITTFLTDLKNYAGFAEVRGEFFKPPYPASTAVQAHLINPEWLVEIEAVAVPGQSRNA
jgi:reactive intermediate/imine deaminase